MSCLRVSALALLSAAFATALSAQEPTVPVVEEDGTIRGSISGVPMSSFLSDEIKAEFTRRVRTSSPPSMTDGLDHGVDQLSVTHLRTAAQICAVRRVGHTFLPPCHHNAVVPGKNTTGSDGNCF